MIKRPDRCATCAEPLVQSARGRARVHCSDRCRDRARRMRESVGGLLIYAGNWERMSAWENRRHAAIAESLRRQAALIHAGDYAAAEAENLENRALDWDTYAKAERAKRTRAGYEAIAAELRAEAARLRGGV